MKYIEISLDRAIELFRQGKDESVFFMRAGGRLERVDSFTFGFRDLVTETNFFEQIEEAHDERD